MKTKILSIIFIAANIFAANLFALDVYLYGREYNSYLRIKNEYEKERSEYDEKKLNSKEFLDKIRDIESIKNGVASFRDKLLLSNAPVIMKIKELGLNKDEAEYFNYLLTLQREDESLGQSEFSFFGRIEENIFDSLFQKKYKGITLKYTNDAKENFPCIALEFDSGYQSITTLKYTIHYSKNDKAEYSAQIYKDTINARNESDAPSIADFGVKAIESVLPFVNESPSKEAALQAGGQNEYFYIDTINLNDYLSKEVSSVISKIGMSVAVNDDNSFAVKFDDTMRLYEANGNIKKDFSKKLAELNVKDIKELYVSTIDSELNIFSSDDYSKSYVFDKDKYLRQAKFFGQNITNPWLIKNGSVDGKPVLWDMANRSIIYAGTEAGSGKIFDFAKVSNFAAVKISREGELARLSNCALTFFDEKGNAKKVITMRDKQGYIGAFNMPFLGDDFFIVVDDRIVENNNRVNCWSCYSFNGELLFSIPMTGILNGFEFSAYKNGILYFTSFSTGAKKLCRFGTKKFSGPEYLKQIGELNAKISENPYDAKNYKALYELYFKNGGSSYLAYNALAKYLELSPADAKANEAKLRLELALQKDTIKEEVQTVFDLYDEYGEMSATQKFLEVSSKIEKLLKQFPGEEDLKNQYNELLDMFGKSSSAVQSNTKDLTIQEIDFAALFPALKNVYAAYPAGTMTLKNESGKPLTNITVSTNIRKYMDYASASKAVQKLENGKAATIELFVPLNDSVLNIQENTNVQVQFTLNWECDGKKNKLNVTRPVTIYKKSAMCWNDSAMLSCFILPNNSTVAEFSANALSVKNKNVVLGKNINVAATLVDAMGAIPLTYVSDPNVSFSNIVDNAYAVDTVRFPNETLKMKGGDCDDMTTLFCSVLESVGIPTAIITVPGHIMAAFDAGENSNLVWQKLNADGKLKIIERDGKIFIPIETTLMNKGFMECWKNASKQLSEKNIIEEFIVIGEQREKYPPVAVEASQGKIALDSKKIVLQKQNDRDEAKNIFEVILLELSAKTNKGAELNSIAKMYRNLGNDAAAVDTLLRATQVDKNYLPAYKNLVTLYNAQGQKDMSAKIVKAMPKEKGATKMAGLDAGVERAANAEDDWVE